MNEKGNDQPAESKVDEYAPKYPEPPEAIEVESEDRSGAGIGPSTWECLTCGTVYTEDHVKCPKDGRPLRKVGAHATPQVGKVAHSEENIERPAGGPQDTPEGFDGAKPGTAGEEPVGGTFQGEQAAPPRGPGQTSG
ncbi:MAG TPA: hypothetical protein VM784_11670 [Actinomycetota bacterium]|nr:hypothetical protein [Actinomycetota bacterium]